MSQTAAESVPVSTYEVRSAAVLLDHVANLAEQGIVLTEHGVRWARDCVVNLNRATQIEGSG